MGGLGAAAAPPWDGKIQHMVCSRPKVRYGKSCITKTSPYCSSSSGLLELSGSHAWTFGSPLLSPSRARAGLRAGFPEGVLGREGIGPEIADWRPAFGLVLVSFRLMHRLTHRGRGSDRKSSSSRRCSVLVWFRSGWPRRRSQTKQSLAESPDRRRS
jgi:hypothetical protein